MGLEPSPEILQRTLSKHLHAFQSTVKIYLDDIIVHTDSHRTCQENTQQIINILKEKNWTINYTKSTLIPQPPQFFLGATSLPKRHCYLLYNTPRNYGTSSSCNRSYGFEIGLTINLDKFLMQPSEPKPP
eukprot:GHVP01039736.1.p1 GENE.GHVP01039736.1~~GHVP01039736.1.p1  ORF type:complete len:130 (+),score=9.83 GHVP01039736.1:391-780(+)